MLAAPRSPVAREAPSPAETLGRLFRRQGVEAGWFAPSFLRATSPRRVDETLSRLRRAHGPAVNVAEAGDGYEVRFAHATVPVTLRLDDGGRIATLLFRPARTSSCAPGDVLDRLAALPGELGVLVREGEVDLLSYASDAPLAVASSFKLAVLLALRRTVEAGERRWDDVVSLTPSCRSLPPGTLQDWPAGAPVTLHTLAALMMSQSDNTATDLLIDVLSREGVEAVAPRLRPLLKTREHCLLKTGQQASRRARFVRGAEAERRSVLAELAGESAPRVADLPAEPADHAVEWHLSPRELCGLMASVHDLDVMALQSAPLHPAGWDRVAVKTGTEPGVLSLNAWLERGSRSFCVSVTINSRTAIDVAWVHLLFQQLTGSLRGDAPRDPRPAASRASSSGEDDGQRRPHPQEP